MRALIHVSVLLTAAGALSGCSLAIDVGGYEFSSGGSGGSSVGCPRGEVLDEDGECADLECRSDEAWNEAGDDCTECVDNAVPTEDHSECVCVRGFAADEGGACLALECAEGFAWNEAGDDCAECGTNQIPTSDQTSCVCRPRFWFDEDEGECIRIVCPGNEELNPDEDGCRCVTGFIRDEADSPCRIVCAAGSLPNLDGSACE